MGNKEINDEQKWTAFVKKLIARTSEDEIEWVDINLVYEQSREGSIGPIFVSEIVSGKFVAVFRYTYDYYTDVDEFDKRQDVAIELVDKTGTKLWRLPEVRPRHELVDLIEFKNADAEGTLNAFLNNDDA